jgi:hypothetical protein
MILLGEKRRTPTSQEIDAEIEEIDGQLRVAEFALRS